MSRSNSPRWTLTASLVGLVAAIVLIDLTLLVAAPPSQTELLRLLLAVGGFGVPFLGVLLGFAGTPRYAVGAILSFPLAALYAYTGLLLPWTQLSFTMGSVGLEIALSIPIVGRPLATVLFGGFTLGEATLRAAFRSHYAIVALGGVGVAAAVARTGLRRVAPERPESRS
jgi:hypothetical protein